MARPTLYTGKTYRISPRELIVPLSAPQAAPDATRVLSLDELRFNLLSPLLQIPPECLICMNEEGAQLRDEAVPNLAMLAGSPETSQQGVRSGSATLQRSSLERRLYVFDREHLDAEPEEVANMLAITADQVLTEAPLGRSFRPIIAFLSCADHCT